MLETVFIVTSIFPDYKHIKACKDSHIIILTKQKPASLHKSHIEWFHIDEVHELYAVYKPYKVLINKELMKTNNFIFSDSVVELIK